MKINKIILIVLVTILCTATIIFGYMYINQDYFENLNNYKYYIEKRQIANDKSHISVSLDKFEVKDNEFSLDLKIKASDYLFDSYKSINKGGDLYLTDCLVLIINDNKLIASTSTEKTLNGHGLTPYVYHAACKKGFNTGNTPSKDLSWTVNNFKLDENGEIIFNFSGTLTEDIDFNNTIVKVTDIKIGPGPLASYPSTNEFLEHTIKIKD